MPRVIATRTGAMALGRMWRNMIRSALAPTDSDQMTNSRSAQRQELGAHEARHPHPAREADDHHDRPDRRLQEGQHREQQEEAGNTSMRSTRRMMADVDGAPVIARGGAEEDTDRRRRCRRTRSPRRATPARRRARGRGRRGRSDRCRTSGASRAARGPASCRAGWGPTARWWARGWRQRTSTATTQAARPRRVDCGGTCARTGASPRASSRRPRSASPPAAQTDARIDEPVGDVGEQVGDRG